MGHELVSRPTQLKKIVAGAVAAALVGAIPVANAGIELGEGLSVTGFADMSTVLFDPKGAELIRLGFLEHSPQALAHILRNLLAVQPAPAELANELRTLEIPALIVAGSEDPGSLPSCQALAELLPRAELVVVPKGGHVVNLTSPAEFNAALDAFLAKLGP